MKLLLLLGLFAPLAICDDRHFDDKSLDNAASKRYQQEIKPLRLALDRWLHTVELQELGLSIRLVKADELPENACGASAFIKEGGIGEIVVLRSDEYVKRPWCAEGLTIASDQINTVVHELLHVMLGLDASEETKVTAISYMIAPKKKK